MSEILHFTAQGFEGEIKIKDYLINYLGFSTSLITKVKSEGVFIGGERVHMRAELCVGDEITVHLPSERSEGIKPLNIPLEVLYEDDFMLAVNKPRGMPTHPSRGNSLPTLAEAVMNYYDGNFVFRAVSRLDKDTSGIVLIAKNAYSAAILGRAMKNGEIEKEYTAVVCGSTPSHGMIEAPIERISQDSIKRGVTECGKYAKTEYELLCHTDVGNSIVRVKPFTGRTHQIRVHLSYIGHPLLGDSLYTDTDSEDSYKLHCNRLSFDFIGKGRITIECPPDFYTPENEKTTE